ncbi:helix-turn-helix transcriptional regulator [Qipengyuania polymorpha]|nr:helix-turn-helix domain-containing protein [Qipengyuania polymorpha]
MRTPEAARYLGVSESLLEKLRVAGDGPLYSKIGRAVLYRKASLDSWIVEQERRHTSGPSKAA